MYAPTAPTPMARARAPNTPRGAEAGAGGPWNGDLVMLVPPVMMVFLPAILAATVLLAIVGVVPPTVLMVSARLELMGRV